MVSNERVPCGYFTEEKALKSEQDEDGEVSISSLHTRQPYSSVSLSNTHMLRYK